MRLTFLLVAPLLAISAPVFAAQSNADAQSVASDQSLPALAKPKKVCRTLDVIGRRIKSSVCHSADEWAAIDKANEEAARNLTNAASRNGSVNLGGGNSSGGSSSAATMGLGSP